MGDTATGSWTSRDLAAHQMNRRCEWNCPTCLKDWNCYCQGPVCEACQNCKKHCKCKERSE